MLSDCCMSCLSVSDVGALWPNGWMDQDETWHGGRPRPRPHCVRWGPLLPQKGYSPQFLTHVSCGQTAVWIKMSLGMEVGLGPGDMVLDGNPAPQKRGHSSPPPLFGQCLLWPNSWMDQDATLYKGRPRPRPHCVRWGPNSLQKGAQPPVFSHI